MTSLTRTLTVLCTALPSYALASASGVTLTTGGPGLERCSACHGATGAAPTVSIVGPATMTSGQTAGYQLVVGGGPGAAATLGRAGMNAGVDNAAVQVLAVTGSTVAVSTNNEVTHLNGGKRFNGAQSVTFDFQLRAPVVTAPTAVTLYAAGNSCNGDNARSGDHDQIASLFITVNPASAPVISTAASASPSTVTGTTAQLSVAATDDGGEGALSYTWSGPPGVSFSPNGTNAAKASTATFTQGGTYALTVTVRDANAQTATSTVSVTVQSSLASLGVSPATASVGVGGTQAFTASGLDQFGRAAALGAVSWSVNGAGNSISTGGVLTAGAAPGGPFTVTAASGGRSATASVTVTAGPPPSFATQPSAATNPVTGTQVTLAALGASAAGEASLVYTWGSSAGPAGVAFSPNGSNAAKATTASFTKAGAYTLTVTARDGAGQQAMATLQLTVSAVLNGISVSPAQAGVSLGGTQQFTVRALDQFSSDIVPPPAASWSASGGGTVSAGGLYTAGSAAGGPFTVTASSAGKTGSATVTIAAGSPPLVTQAASAAPESATKLSLRVLGVDDAPETALTYTWAALAPPAPVTFAANGTNAAKSTSVTLSRAGEYTFVVTLKDATNLTATSTVRAVVASTLDTLSVLPANVSVAPLSAQQFTVVAADQFGASLLPAPAVAWSVSGGGAIGSSGLFRALGAAGGPFTVTASAVGRAATASVSIEAGGAPSFASLPAASPSTVTGRATSLRALGADASGESALTYRWRATLAPGPVAVSANDSNAAKSTVATFTAVGRYTLSVTLENASSKIATESVEVNVEPTLETLWVAPAEAQVMAGAALDFTATGVDQFGAALGQLPQLSWAMGAGGLVDASGHFTARATAGGPFVLTATAGPVRGTALVTVMAAPLAMPMEPQVTPQVMKPAQSGNGELTGEVDFGCQSAGGLALWLLVLVLKRVRCT